MALLFINESFQYNGKVFRCGEEAEDATLKVGFAELKEEKAKGKHPKTKRWMSPLFNHCSPADKESSEVFEEKVKEVPKEDDQEEVERLRGEFDKIGKAYDKRWQLKRLQNELVKAQKEAGV